MRYLRRAFATALQALALATIAASGTAGAASEFYKGKEIIFAIPGTPGGDYDTRSRLLARFMGRHIPGNPEIEPENMPGAGGLEDINWVSRVARRDGTVLSMMIQSFPLNQLISGPGIQYDVTKLQWIGNITNSPNTISVWHTSKVKTIADAYKYVAVLGAAGTASPAIYYPLVMNALLGTKFKVIAGYPGGNEINLAMERGEVDGRGSVSLASWANSHPDWLRDKKLNFIVQTGTQRSRELPDVPLLVELAKNASDRGVFKLLSADTEFARAIVTTPETPKDRVETLRRAFEDTVRDPEYLAAAAKMGSDVQPSTGAQVQAAVLDFMSSPQDVVSRTKQLVEAVMKK